MKKLKQNSGYTLSVVLVIMIVLAILTSSIIFSVTFKTNTTNKIVQASVEKIELEKVTYSYLNNVVIKGSIIILEDTSIGNSFTYSNYTFKVDLVDDENDIYLITVISPSLSTLTTRIDFQEDHTSYTILSWGVK